jgi:acetylornithine deacetylase
MKGSIASMLGAIKRVVDSGTALEGDLTFAGVVDEEYKSIGTRALVREYRADSAIVGEPTSLSIGIAHKGYVWVEIQTKGRSAHGSVPEKGVDAILNMSRLVSRFPSLERRYVAAKHPLLGGPRLHTSTVKGGTEWAVVPDSCTLRAERRTLPGENSDSFLAELREVARGLKEEDSDFRVSFKKVFEQPPMEVSRDAPVVRQVESSARKVLRRQPKYVGLPYWTDAAILDLDGNMPTCLFGPGDIAVAHSADEFVAVQEVADGARIFEDCILRFCGGPSAVKSPD